MRTTLVSDDHLFRQLQQRADEEGRTLSDVIQEMLRRGLKEQSGRQPRPPMLLTFATGAPAVELADRDRLNDLLDQ